MKIKLITCHLNTRERILLYVLILFLINYIFYQSIFRVHLDEFSSESLRLLTLNKQVQKEQELINQAELVDKENKSLYSKIYNGAESVPDRIFLQNIIENIKEISEMNQTKIISLETHSPIKIKSYYNTSVTIKLEGYYENTLNFFMSIERKQPYIGTDQLTILKIPNTDRYSLAVVLHVYSFSDELAYCDSLTAFC